ncbi:hypothetical protein LEM8419_00210 [Neolewinella maritima]|uniref:Tetratricopeptide repeat protein n=1 Tax=Neolewinella maritima TaxID=1383882 RepID=A0ABM9AWR3_9BACT|nr:hypothetical protein [Neolewinella maritima]CAH0998907.1 hypothetical protein LEM8419_00210 [Neolewinella maritima]
MNTRHLFATGSFLLLSLLLSTSCADRATRPPAYSAVPDDPVSCAPATNDQAWYEDDKKAPLFKDLTDLEFPITARKKAVNTYFNQGMVLAYGFNHAEAARSFYYATRLEPDCPMAYWGYAYVLGPNYNAGMEPNNYPRAYAAVQQAQELAKTKGTPTEKALIGALAQRYSADAPADRSHLDEAYAAAMREVWERFPNDAEVGTLLAEALMDLHPWDLWDKAGEPRPWTPEILELLDQVLLLDPDHPGANHLYIHAIEASHTPEQGLVSARRLAGGLVPGAGHLVHMPSHIYIRTGHYHEGSLANREAVKVDSNYITTCRAQGAYPLIYHPHNYHFLAATATLAGHSEWAIDAAKRIARHADNDLVTIPALGLLQHFYTVPDYVLVKFGHWDEILNALDVRRDLTYPKLIRHYARGMAQLGKDNIAAAREELAALQALLPDPTIDSLVIGVNSARNVASIAERVLAGEIAAHAGELDEAAEILGEAVAIEDALNYMEPPDWFFSVRHHLGAVLVDAGRYREAVEVYEQDLHTFPKNGWALHGLQAAYRGLDEQVQEAAVSERIAEVWATADVELEGSRVR